MTIALWDLIVSTFVSSIPILILVAIFLFLGFRSISSAQSGSAGLTPMAFMEASLELVKQHNLKLEQHLQETPDTPASTTVKETKDGAPVH